MSYDELARDLYPQHAELTMAMLPGDATAQRMLHLAPIDVLVSHYHRCHVVTTCHAGEADLPPSLLRRGDPPRTSRKHTPQLACSVGHRLPISRSWIIAPLKLGEPPNMPNKARL
jgi:hypothetical protein